MTQHMLLPLALTVIVGTLLLFWRGSTRLFVVTSTLFAVAVLLYLGYFAADYFTGDGINDAVLFHVVAGTEGVSALDYPDLLTYIALTLTALLLYLWLATNRFREHKKEPAQPGHRQSHNSLLYAISPYAVGPILGFASLAVNPATIDGMSLWQAYGNVDTEDALSEFIRPIQIIPRKTKHKNIVYVYAESLERTYFDETKFPGLIRQLRSLEQSAISFHGLVQVPLTGWTIAGMTASQCGIPLSTFTTGRNSMGIREQFLPGATCLGDLLKSEGYHLAYIGGADKTFAGKGNFYESHGFNEILGMTEIDALMGGNLPKSKWGIYDDATLELTYRRFEQLSEEDAPFGLFALTLDTHPPGGHATPACAGQIYRDGKNSMLNAVYCADKLLGMFVERILSSHYAHNTLLVVGSDHLVMRSAATELLDAPGLIPRNNMLMIFDPSQEPRVVSRAGTTLDIAPTLLNALGYGSHEFAMGRDLLGTQPTMIEKFGFGAFASKVEHLRIELWNYWNPAPKNGNTSSTTDS